MTRAIALVLWLAGGCGGETSKPPERPAVARNPAAVAELVHEEVIDGGLWFPDAACEKEFGAPQKIAAPRTKAFAECLRGLPLRASPRKDAMSDVAVLTYAPGFEIEARVVDGWLTWIGWEAERDGTDIAPTLTAAAFEALRTDSNPPSTVPAEPDGYAWFKVCIDAAGNITNIDQREATSANASIDLLAGANSWELKPFEAGNGAIPACAMLRLGAGATSAEQLPWPPSPNEKGLNVAPSRMKLLSGQKFVVPNDLDKLAMQDHGVSRVVTSAKLCIDTRGRVTDVVMLRRSGLAGYDRKILERLKARVYAPFLGPNGPMAACTGITFIYRQGPHAVTVDQHTM